MARLSALACLMGTVLADPIKIACVGDSITWGAFSTGGNATYPGQLQVMLDAAKGANKYRVTNLGHNGRMMLKNSSAPYWNTSQFREFAAGTWDIVLIMLGTNDAHNTCGAPASRAGCSSDWNVDCGGPNATSASTHCRYAQDFASMVQIALSRGTTPGVAPKVYVLTPPPLMAAEPGFPTMQTTINTLYPKLIPQMAAQTPGVQQPPIDMYAAFGGVADWEEKFPASCTLDTAKAWKPCAWWCDAQSCNQCHPNNNGYTHFARVVFERLGF